MWKEGRKPEVSSPLHDFRMNASSRREVMNLVIGREKGGAAHASSMEKGGGRLFQRKKIHAGIERENSGGETTSFSQNWRRKRKGVIEGCLAQKK